MNNLFQPAVAEDTRQRILRLTAESERQWGSMGLAQTLAHCSAGLQMAMGEVKPKRAPFPGNVIGRLIKPLVFRDDQPMRRNSPSSPELFGAKAEACDFEQERTRLLATVDRFVSEGAGCCTEHPHPFFGPLTPEQWAVIMFKHVDHHLRQFGV